MADEPQPLFPAEAALVAGAGQGRRREFATTRGCARAALAQLGVPSQPILRDAAGAPTWPAGIVGSLTHCDGYRAAAVARSSQIAALGIDAEPHEPLPDGVLDLIATPAERTNLAEQAARAPGVHADRLLFSAKEAAFKAWSPRHRGALDLTAVTVTLDAAGTFTAWLSGQALPGRWTVDAGLVLTAVTLPV